MARDASMIEMSFSALRPRLKPDVPSMKMPMRPPKAPGLALQMAGRIRFRTSTLTAIGLRRNGVLGTETASDEREHLGLMLGAKASALNDAAGGFGITGSFQAVVLEELFSSRWTNLDPRLPQGFPASFQRSSAAPQSSALHN
jgi:hypothetical protein